MNLKINNLKKETNLNRKFYYISKKSKLSQKHWTIKNNYTKIWKKKKGLLTNNYNFKQSKKKKKKTIQMMNKMRY